MYKLKVWHVHIYIKNTGKGKNLDKLSVWSCIDPHNSEDEGGNFFVTQEHEGSRHHRLHQFGFHAPVQS